MHTIASGDTHPGPIHPCPACDEWETSIGATDLEQLRARIVELQDVIRAHNPDDPILNRTSFT